MTENAKFHYLLEDSDITTDSRISYGAVDLSVTYTITVYATAEGYTNSDKATATLCWMEAEPKTEGMMSNIAKARGNAILIQSNNGTMNISGVTDGDNITVYSPSGVMVGSAKVYGTSTSIATNLRSGELAIVKIGDKTIKVVMQ